MKTNNRTGQEKMPASSRKVRMSPAGIALYTGLAVLLLVLVAVVALQNGGLAGSDRVMIQDEELVFQGDAQKVLPQDAQRKDTYVVGTAQLPTMHHSYLQTMEGAQVINDLVYPGLAVLEDGDYHYLLAREITFSDNGRTASVQLDPQACCSDGCRLTADDVIYSWHYLANSQIGYDRQEILLRIAGMQEYLDTGAASISGISKVSDTELTVSFVNASLDNFAVFTVPVLHPQTHEYARISKDTTHLGYGAYQIESHKLYTEAVLVRNAFAVEAGIYPTVRVVVADLARLEQQEIDTMLIAADAYERVQALGSYDIYSEYSEERDFLLFDTDDEQMRDVANRIKLAEALNRTDLVNRVYEDGVLSHGVSAGDKSGTSYETLVKKEQSAEGLSVALANVFSGMEAAVFTELRAQLEAAGATITEEGTATSLYYYYGRVDELLSQWALPGFYEGLNGKTLEEVGDLLEESLAGNMYAIPLHNEVYYTVNLCGKERIGALGNRY